MFDELEQYEKQREAYDGGIDRFSQYLMSGESILWQGESQKGGGLKVNAGGAFKNMFAVFWLAFAIFWTLTATFSGGLFGLFGVPFILIGIFLLRGNGGKKYYAITDRRVLTKKRLNSEYLNRISNINFIEGNNNIGSVIYGTNAVEYVTNSDGDGRYRQVGGGLYGVFNPQEVYRILNDAVYQAMNNG